MKKIILFIALAVVVNLSNAQTIQTVVLNKGGDNTVIKEILNFCQKKLAYNTNDIKNSQITAKNELKFMRQNFRGLWKSDINFLKCANFAVETNGDKFDLAVTEINFKSKETQKKIYNSIIKKNTATLNGEILTRYIFFKKNMSIIICYTQEINNERIEQLFKEMLQIYRNNN